MFHIWSEIISCDHSQMMRAATTTIIMIIPFLWKYVYFCEPSQYQNTHSAYRCAYICIDFRIFVRQKRYRSFACVSLHLNVLSPHIHTRRSVDRIRCFCIQHSTHTTRYVHCTLYKGGASVCLRVSLWMYYKLSHTPMNRSSIYTCIHMDTWLLTIL